MEAVGEGRLGPGGDNGRPSIKGILRKERERDKERERERDER